MSQTNENGSGHGNEERLLHSIAQHDARRPEELSEGERLARYMNYDFVLEAVAPYESDPTRSMIGRCPWPGPLVSAKARARDMIAEGKAITHVIIRDTRSWKPVAMEKR